MVTVASQMVWLVLPLGSTLLRAASKLGSVPVVPHGMYSGEATQAHRAIQLAGYSYNLQQ